MPRRGAGFTLIEVLVVVVIIGVMATYLSLSMGSGHLDKQIEQEAQRLQQLMRFASDEAQLQGLEIGFRHTLEGYEFLSSGVSGRWVAFDDGPLRARKLGGPLYLELRTEGRLIPPGQMPAPTTADPEAEDDAESDADADDDAKAQADDQEILPQVLLLSSGEATPFTLDIKARDHQAYYHLAVDLLGRQSLERQEGFR